MGPALEHYRCFTVYFPTTCTTRTVDTVRYFLHTIPFPQTTLEYHLCQAGADIIAILTNPSSTITPEIQSGNKMHNAILELANILKCRTYSCSTHNQEKITYRRRSTSEGASPTSEGD